MAPYCLLCTERLGCGPSTAEGNALAGKLVERKGTGNHVTGEVDIGVSDVAVGVERLHLLVDAHAALKDGQLVLQFLRLSTVRDVDVQAQRRLRDLSVGIAGQATGRNRPARG